MTGITLHWKVASILLTLFRQDRCGGKLYLFTLHKVTLEQKEKSKVPDNDTNSLTNFLSLLVCDIESNGNMVLQNICSRVIHTVSRQLSNKPYIVIIEGNIGSGKTTFLQPFMKHKNIVEVCQEPVHKWQNLQVIR